MNQRQRIVLIVAFLVVLGMALFPPWRGLGEFGDATAGYRFVFWLGQSRYLIRIDSARLGVQLLAVLALTGAAYLILRPRR